MSVKRVRTETVVEFAVADEPEMDGANNARPVRMAPQRAKVLIFDGELHSAYVYGAVVKSNGEVGKARGVAIFDGSDIAQGPDWLIGIFNEVMR